MSAARAIPRASRVAVLAALFAAALFGARAARPADVFACYCTVPETVAAYRTDADVVIVAGTLTDVATFRVERIYRGPIALGPARIWVDTSSCGFPMKVDERWVMAARLFNGQLRPDICTSHARVGTPAGEALLADIAAVYGAQAPLGEDPPAPTAPVVAAPIEPTPAAASAQPASPATTDVALPLAIGGAVVAALLLFGGLIVLSRRGQQGRDA